MSPSAADSAPTHPALSAEAQASVGRLWRKRGIFEREASVRFAQLGERLAGLAAHPEVVRLAREASLDEARHAQLCDALSTHFGVSPAPPRPIEIEQTLPASLDPRHQGVLAVIALSCITETLSAALLNELVAQATDPLVRSTMHEILTDEIRHARLGWAHLAAEQARGGLHDLGRFLPALLQGTVQPELFSHEPEPPWAASLAGHGALPRAARRQIIESTLEQVVFPGLARFGTRPAAGQGWLQQQCTPSR